MNKNRDEKPKADCKPPCEWPRGKYGNGSGHHPDCEFHKKWYLEFLHKNKVEVGKIQDPNLF